LLNTTEEIERLKREIAKEEDRTRECQREINRLRDVVREYKRNEEVIQAQVIRISAMLDDAGLSFDSETGGMLVKINTELRGLV